MACKHCAKIECRVEVEDKNTNIECRVEVEDKNTNIECRVEVEDKTRSSMVDGPFSTDAC